jgi:hypothetical protein
MSEKFATLKVKVFFDSAGKPTCSLDINEKRCEFLGTRNFGIKMACMLGEQVNLKVDNGGLGLIRPHKSCKLHKEMVKK